MDLINTDVLLEILKHVPKQLHALIYRSSPILCSAVNKLYFNLFIKNKSHFILARESELYKIMINICTKHWDCAYKRCYKCNILMCKLCMDICEECDECICKECLPKHLFCEICNGKLCRVCIQICNCCKRLCCIECINSYQICTKCGHDY